MTLSDEIREGYLVKKEMKAIWAVQLEMLELLLSVCAKHNLRIWADGGTLLGAVRHHGYIPWDDDIDMVMLRPDYDKLVEIANQEFQPPFFFQSAYSEKSIYPRGHAQLRKDGTAAILPGDIQQNFHQGIFIDIFPYDAVPNDEGKMKEQINLRNAYFSHFQDLAYRSFSFKKPFSSSLFFIKKLVIYKYCFIKQFTDFENLFRKYRIEDNQYVSSFATIVDLKRFKRNKEVYEQTIYLPFEDIQIPVPIGYDSILTQQYGDYMTPRRAPSYHGSFIALSANKSYLQYLPELRRQRRKARWAHYFNALFHLNNTQ